jgi:hypothetical protein
MKLVYQRFAASTVSSVAPPPGKDHGMKSPCALFAIDPGLGSTGWAMWQYPAQPPFRPDWFGRIKGTSAVDMSFERRALQIGHALYCELTDHAPLRRVSVVCEFPEFQGGAVRQMGWRKGDLQKLTFLVGAIAGTMAEVQIFQTVRPSEWKGQLPKDVVIRRILAQFGETWGTDTGAEKDTWDAIGIGLYILKGKV